MNLSYSQINLINHQNMIVLAPACKGNALNFPHRKRFPKETAIAWLLKKKKKKKPKTSVSSEYQVKTQMAAAVQGQGSGGKIRMLGCSAETQWSLSVCPWLSQHLFLFAAEHHLLAPSGVSEAPRFSLNWKFCLQAKLWLDWVPPSNSLSIPCLHLAGARTWACWGGRPTTVHSWRRYLGNGAQLPSSWRWF